MPTFEISSQWGCNNITWDTDNWGERDFIFISKELANYYDIYIKSNGQGNQFAVYAADIHGWDYSKCVGNVGTTYQFINNSGLYVLPMTTTDFTKVDIDWHSTINGSKFNNCTYLWFYAQIGGSATSNSFILRFVPKS